MSGREDYIGSGELEGRICNAASPLDLFSLFQNNSLSLSGGCCKEHTDLFGQQLCWLMREGRCDWLTFTEAWSEIAEQAGIAPHDFLSWCRHLSPPSRVRTILRTELAEKVYELNRSEVEGMDFFDEICLLQDLFWRYLFDFLSLAAADRLRGQLAYRKKFLELCNGGMCLSECNVLEMKAAVRGQISDGMESAGRKAALLCYYAIEDEAQLARLVSDAFEDWWARMC